MKSRGIQPVYTWDSQLSAIMLYVTRSLLLNGKFKFDLVHLETTVEKLNCWRLTNFSVAKCSSKRDEWKTVRCLLADECNWQFPMTMRVWENAFLQESIERHVRDTRALSGIQLGIIAIDCSSAIFAIVEPSHKFAIFPALVTELTLVIVHVIWFDYIHFKYCNFRKYFFLMFFFIYRLILACALSCIDKKPILGIPPKSFHKFLTKLITLTVSKWIHIKVTIKGE